MRKGSGRYCAVLVDLDRHEIIGLLKSRKQDEIRKVLLSWGSEVLNSIKLVSMDLSSSYKSIINEVLPDVEIVADRFHVMKQINDGSSEFSMLFINPEKLNSFRAKDRGA